MIFNCNRCDTKCNENEFYNNFYCYACYLLSCIQNKHYIFSNLNSKYINSQALIDVYDYYKKYENRNLVSNNIYRAFNNNIINEHMKKMLKLIEDNISNIKKLSIENVVRICHLCQKAINVTPIMENYIKCNNDGSIECSTCFEENTIAQYKRDRIYNYLTERMMLSYICKYKSENDFQLKQKNATFNEIFKTREELARLVNNWRKINRTHNKIIVIRGTNCQTFVNNSSPYIKYLSLTIANDNWAIFKDSNCRMDEIRQFYTI